VERRRKRRRKRIEPTQPLQCRVADQL